MSEEIYYYCSKCKESAYRTTKKQTPSDCVWCGSPMLVLNLKIVPKAKGQTMREAVKDFLILKIVEELAI